VRRPPNKTLQRTDAMQLSLESHCFYNIMIRFDGRALPMPVAELGR